MEHFISNSLDISRKKLSELCNSKHGFKLQLFWTSEAYGFGKYIRKYGYYPNFLPLAIYNEHGVGSVVDNPFKHELESYAPVMLYHSPEAVRIWKKFSKKPCYTFYSPFVFYRRTNKIVQDRDAIGTIVFPDHSIPSMDEVSDTQAYIDQLKNLPEKFQPISACLHFQDIRIGRHEIYLKNNIPVYSAGDDFNLFIERFYEILRKFKYASSNQVGSSLFYAVEMGVPFFVYGNKAENINKSDPNYPLGKLTDYENSEFHQTLDRIFSGFDCEINIKKREIVERNLGIYDGISRKKMAYVLYSSLLKLFFYKSFYRDIGGRLIREIKALVYNEKK